MKRLLKKFKYVHGFTLIELMVVISIISLLSSTVLASLNEARIKAIWTKSIQDIKTIETALALYFEDHGDWPESGGTIAATNPAQWDALGSDLAPYLSQIPYPSFAQDDTATYTYSKASDDGDPPWNTTIRDSSDGSRIGCVFIRHGYYLNIYWYPNFYGVAMNDQGIDPEAFEIFGGESWGELGSTVCSP